MVEKTRFSFSCSTDFGVGVLQKLSIWKGVMTLNCLDVDEQAFAVMTNIYFDLGLGLRL